VLERCAQQECKTLKGLVTHVFFMLPKGFLCAYSLQPLTPAVLWPRLRSWRGLRGAEAPGHCCFLPSHPSQPEPVLWRAVLLQRWGRVGKCSA
jgi:hypothetical protein